MRVTQTIFAAAIAASAVLAEADAEYGQSTPQKLGLVAGSSTTPASANQPISSKPKPVVKAAAPQTPPPQQPPQKKKTILQTAAGLSKMLFAKPQRTKQRVNAKKNGQYLRKQKSAAELTTDATGTKQPASLSDPNVHVMEAFSDLIKRYAGQANPDKSQFREDIKTVFESRAEKGDLTTKQYKQNYKMKKLKPNGVGKRNTKVKRDLDLEIEAREAEPEAEAIADPEAVVYETEIDLTSRDVTEDHDTLIARKASDDDDEVVDEDVDDDEESESAKSKKKAIKDAAIKKKKAAKKLAQQKKKIAALIKKKAAALKTKLAASKKKAKAHQKSKDAGAIFDFEDDDESSSRSPFDDDEGDDFEDLDDLLVDESRKSKSKSKNKNKSGTQNYSAQHRKNLKKIAKLRAAIVATQRQIDANHPAVLAAQAQPNLFYQPMRFGAGGVNVADLPFRMGRGY